MTLVINALYANIYTSQTSSPTLVQPLSCFKILTKMLSKSTILLYFLFSYYGYGDEFYCGRFRESFDSLLYNRVLIGQVIKSLFTRGGILSCAHRCLSLPSCSSYNYQMSESDYGVCELNGGKEGVQENLVEKVGYVFARLRKVTQLCFHLCLSFFI